MVTRYTLRRISHGIEALAMQVLRKPIRFVWAEPDETTEAATERYLEEHPEARGYELIVASWLPPGSSDRPEANAKAETFGQGEAP